MINVRVITTSSSYDMHSARDINLKTKDKNTVYKDRIAL